MHFLKKKNIIIMIALVVVLAVSGVAIAATIPTVSFLTPASSSYLLKGNTFKVSATINNYPTSVAFYYNGYKQGSMSQASSGSTTYQMNWTPTTWYKPSNSGNTWYFLTGKINAYNSAGTGYATRPMYVTVGDKYLYPSVDISWC